MDVVVASARHQNELGALFERADVPCFCRYWHFAGTTNEWLARSAHEPLRNRAEMEASLAAGDGEMAGMVAEDDGRVVGWLKLASSTRVQKLYDQRLYRGLPCFAGDRSGILTVGCLLVDPERRRRGVARALLRAAVSHARATGARAIEAFPRRGDPLRDADVFMGPWSIYASEGFRVVNDFAPYPVLRLDVSAPQPGETR